ncbi:hypothetical protein GQ42DRAFT_8982 [Ramicandelaber brevisporus]|nr:hypothetical protein GQ42DRAFT_8982 [Ramicandelaber brevisporus]
MNGKRGVRWVRLCLGNFYLPRHLVFYSSLHTLLVVASLNVTWEHLFSFLNGHCFHSKLLFLVSMLLLFVSIVSIPLIHR